MGEVVASPRPEATTCAFERDHAAAAGLPGLLAQAAPLGRDRAVAETLVFHLEYGLIQVEDWHGEDGCQNTCLGDKRINAMIMRESGATVPKFDKLIEIVGADYTYDKLRAIHRECDSRGLSYEFW